MINCEGALLAAALLARFHGFFTGGRRGLLLVLPAACYFCSWLVAMPHFIGVNSDMAFWLKCVGSGITIVIGLVAIDQLITVGTQSRARRTVPELREARDEIDVVQPVVRSA